MNDPEYEKQMDKSQNASTLSVQQTISHVRSSSDLIKKIIADKEFLKKISSYYYDPNVEEKLQQIGIGLLLNSKDYELTLKEGDQDIKPNSVRIKEILEQIAPQYIEKYRDLVQRFDEWRSNREVLIEKLKIHINHLDRHSKVSTVVRLISSFIDVSGSVGGLLSKSEWASHAMMAASYCGLFGLVTTVSEVGNSKRILDDVSENLENDLKLLEPIVKWFEKETSDLDSTVQDMFPHGIDREIVQHIQEASAEQDNYLKVFRAALVSNVRKDTNLLANRDFLHSLQLFARSEVASYWWNKIIYRKHPIELDFGRMALQMEFGQLQSIVFQCIPALPLEQQRLGSLPVAGRIMLNLLTMYDSFTDLQKGARSMYSDKLRKQLNKMVKELRTIENTVERMKPQDFNGIQNGQY